MTHGTLIAHVVFRFGMGGLENGLVNLINRMPRPHWRHAVISLTDVSQEFAERIERDDVEFVSLRKRAGHLLPYYPALYRLMRKLSPSIVHTRNLAALEASVPAWAGGVRVRIHGEHGWDMQDPHGTNTRYRRARQLYRPFVTHYVALSQHLETYLRQEVRVPDQRISQIYNGVDTDRFRAVHRGRAPIAGCPFTDAHDWLVGTVGRMEPVKDQLNLARAFANAVAQDRGCRERMKLVFVGDGSLRHDVEQFVAQAGIRKQVWFAGERDDVDAVMRGLDCFVLPSLAEGISNTILEAMATSLPIIATAVGGNGELIESGLSGTLVPRSRSDPLAQAMIDYFANPALARRHAKSARHAAERQFSIGSMVSDYVRMYQRELVRAGLPVAGPDAIDIAHPVRGATPEACHVSEPQSSTSGMQ